MDQLCIKEDTSCDTDLSEEDKDFLFEFEVFCPAFTLPMKGAITARSKYPFPRTLQIFLENIHCLTYKMCAYLVSKCLFYS